MVPEDLPPGIIQILRNDGIVLGTGFLVSNNLISTCDHVIQNKNSDPGNKVKVRFYLNGNVFNAIVMPELWHSPDKEDLSVIPLEDELPSNVKALLPGSSEETTGHKVCTFGFFLLQEKLKVSGDMERSLQRKLKEDILQIDSNKISQVLVVCLHVTNSGMEFSELLYAQF